MERKIKDLISRADVIEAVRIAYGNTLTGKTLIRMIQKIPSADRPSIVRCKDCEYQGDELLLGKGEAVIQNDRLY